MRAWSSLSLPRQSRGPGIVAITARQGNDSSTAPSVLDDGGGGDVDGASVLLLLLFLACLLALLCIFHLPIEPRLQTAAATAAATPPTPHWHFIPTPGTAVCTERFSLEKREAV